MLNLLFNILCFIILVTCFYFMYLLVRMRDVGRELEEIEAEMAAVKEKVNELNECEHDITYNDRCIFCGLPVPEGRLLCPACELQHS